MKRGKMAVNCSDVTVALGANLESTAGAPLETLKAALDCFEAEGLMIRDVSPFYETPCFPKGMGPDYVNAAVTCETHLSPHDTLAALHRIEARFGRKRVTRWAGRTLDLDLLFFGQMLLPDAKTHQKWREMALIVQETETPNEILIPHPRLQDRAFVLVPLADVAPEWVHPVLNLSVKEMLEALPIPDRDAVVPL
jgi:2-amino-4-hydroxy-6-hydroxymethyldihydropteridine diphosphokinase